MKKNLWTIAIVLVWLAIMIYAFKWDTIKQTKIDKQTEILQRIEKNISALTMQSTYDVTYEACKYRALEDIMITETYRGTIFKEPGGYECIGYGHLMLPDDKFKVLTAEQAYQLLKKDFEKCCNIAQTIEWEPNKIIAVAHALYKLGPQFVDDFEQDPVTILDYVNYNGKYSPQLAKARCFEYIMYYQ